MPNRRGHGWAARLRRARELHVPVAVASVLLMISGVLSAAEGATVAAGWTLTGGIALAVLVVAAHYHRRRSATRRGER